MSRPKLLDLFCCEGGASEGYRRAGFDVYGVDLFVDYSQKRYPFASHKGDAILALARLLAGERIAFTHKDGTVEALGLSDFDAIAASPPCQAYSITKHSHSNEHPDLLGPVRYLLKQTGLPYVIENVPGAPLDNPLTLCGTEFDLIAEDADGQLLHLKRHRLFESNLFLVGAGGCRCREFKRRGIGVGGVYGGGSVDRQHAKHVRRGGYTPGKEIRAALIGCDWMTLHGLSQSIPPAYTHWIGLQILVSIESDAAMRSDSSPEHTPYTSASPGRNTGSPLSTDGLSGSESCGCSHPSMSEVNGECSPESNRGRDVPA